jgi:protease-4
MDADRIVASPATLTGSIGVFFMFPTIQRSLERLGVHTDGVGTTALSGEFRLDRPMGDASKDLLQQTVQRTYDDFIGRVARARKQPVEGIDAVAQGRVWAGADAKRLGLVDELGGTADAIRAAAKLAKLGNDFEVEYFDSETGLGDAFGLRIRLTVARMVAPLLPSVAFPVIPSVFSPLLAEAQRIARLKDPGSLYAYCLACSID